MRYFAELKDSRVERTRRHLLQDIVLIAIAAILSGAGGWDEIERYGKAKRSWWKSFLQLPHGIASHDTFNRVFQALDPAELEKSFLDWPPPHPADGGRGGGHRRQELAGTAQAEGTPIVHPAGRLYPGGKGKPAVPVGRHQGFVPDARCRSRR